MWCEASPLRRRGISEESSEQHTASVVLLYGTNLLDLPLVNCTGSAGKWLGETLVGLFAIEKT